ncbi:hypothetical protein F230042K4_04240 [Mediterraneibacter glycyrrhizinilyticus]
MTKYTNNAIVYNKKYISACKDVLREKLPKQREGEHYEKENLISIFSDGYGCSDGGRMWKRKNG